MELGKTDSAYHYFQKANMQAATDKIFTDNTFLTAFCDYYHKVGNYNTALEYYFKAEEKMKTSLSNGISQDGGYIYRNISEIYSILGEREKEKYYLKKFHESEDIYKETESEQLSTAIEDILHLKNEEQLDLKTKGNVKIILVLAGSVLLIMKS